MKNVNNAEMINIVIDPDLERRDILESEIPRDVLDILLKDRTTGKNILWMTDSYEHLESTFDIKMGIHDLIDADTISCPGNKIIRPRVDKSKEEQRERVQKKAEVFTPSWICNNMNNLIDAVADATRASLSQVEVVESEERELYAHVRAYIASARETVYAVANSAMVEAYWNVGREIVEKQGGSGRAAVGLILV